MANPEHVRRLVESDKDSWNAWRVANPYELVDLTEENLELSLKQNWKITPDNLANLSGFDLRMTNLHQTNLSNTDLSGAVINDAFLPMFDTPPPAQYNKVDFMRSRLVGTTLRNAVLNECVLSGADLTDADLTDAKFPGTNLWDVRFSGANLMGTHFAESDLTGANFVGCDLGSAHLINAKLECTSLHNADRIFRTPYHDRMRRVIRDGNASSIEEFYAWIARVLEKTTSGGSLDYNEFENARQYIDANLPKIDEKLGTADSVATLFAKVEERIRLYELGFTRHRFKVYYRGHGCSRWRIASSLDREGLRHVEPDLLREAIGAEPDEFRDAKSTLDQLVLARHHSLPARLVDVTKNPLVALYFACHPDFSCNGNEEHKNCPRDGRIEMLVTPTEMTRAYDSDTISLVAAMSLMRDYEEEVLLTKCPEQFDSISKQSQVIHEHRERPGYDDAMRRLIHFVARDKPYFESAIDIKDLFRVFVFEPKRAFARIRAQSGAFLISAYHRSFDAMSVSSNGPKSLIYDQCSVDVPYDRKATLMRQLEYVQINDETMLRGLDPVAKSIADRYK